MAQPDLWMGSYLLIHAHRYSHHAGGALHRPSRASGLGPLLSPHRLIFWALTGRTCSGHAPDPDQAVSTLLYLPPAGLRIWTLRTPPFRPSPAAAVFSLCLPLRAILRSGFPLPYDYSTCGPLLPSRPSLCLLHALQVCPFLFLFWYPFPLILHVLLFRRYL